MYEVFELLWLPLSVFFSDERDPCLSPFTVGSFYLLLTGRGRFVVYFTTSGLDEDSNFQFIPQTQRRK